MTTEESACYKVYREGNMWCAVGPGFTNIRESVSGFGSTAAQALSALVLTENRQVASSTSDSEIEKEIQAKGLTAPRVTPQMIEAATVAEYTFTAWNAISEYCPRMDELKLLTICVLVLKNGFTVTGESACASPENFDAALGNKIARQKAKDKVWMLEGYALKERLRKESLYAQKG